MKTIEAIQAEQNAILAAADERAEGEQSLTSEEVQKYETLEAELFAVQKTADIKHRHALARVTGGPAVIGATPKGDAALDFAFLQYLKTGHPNADIQQFAQTEGTTTAGGYTVPDTFLDRLIERRVAFGGFMNEAENITTADGRPIAFPTVVPAAYTEADIAAEGAATAAGADIVFGEVTLGAYKYTSAGTSNLPLKVSLELAQDSAIDIGAFVSSHLGKRIARKQAYDLINGSNSGEPQGIAYGTAGTVEADPTGFAAFSNLVHSLDPAYRDGAKWIMNDTTAKTIEQLLDGPSGTSGRPLLVNALNGIENPSNGYRLLGYPVVIDQAMPTWAADDVIGVAFGDWKAAYIVRHVKDVQILVNPYAVTGYIVYDAWARMDGKVQDSYAYVTGEGV